jgi:hypothetical protein
LAGDPLLAFCDANVERLDEIVEALASYQPQPVDGNRLRRWLRQLDPPHYGVGLRLIENVDFFTPTRLHGLLRELYRLVKVDLAADGFRQLESFVFVPVGGTGDSGQEIVTRFRSVNRVDRTNARLFQVVELQRVIYEAEVEGRQLALIFLDDFIGTGKQVTDFWTEVLSQHINPNQSIYLGVVAACREGVDKIQRDTPLRVIPVHFVQPRHFLPSTDRFTNEEKAIITEYCGRIGNPPLGVGGLGLMLAFAHGCPNNVLSILRGSKRQRNWRGILPRYEDLAV